MQRWTSGSRKRDTRRSRRLNLNRRIRIVPFACAENVVLFERILRQFFLEECVTTRITKTVELCHLSKSKIRDQYTVSWIIVNYQIVTITPAEFFLVVVPLIDPQSCPSCLLSTVSLSSFS